MNSLTILERLIAFPTVSRDSNLALIDYARGFLSESGIESTLVHDETGQKADLYATIGPTGRAGVMLSGHTDVVPVDGQDWTVEPFALTARDARLYGRGAADMNGFVACALNAARRAAAVHAAASGAVLRRGGGLHRRAAADRRDGEGPLRPALCIVGEPTSMAVATGHKGKTPARAICVGREGRSALAPMALNAVHLACDFVGEVRRAQAKIAEHGARDGDYDVPYTTLHVGRIAGGVALNIVPNLCEVDFEVRNLAEDDPQAILAELGAAAARIAGEARTQVPEADIRIEVTNAYSRARHPNRRCNRRVPQVAHQGRRLRRKGQADTSARGFD